MVFVTELFRRLVRTVRSMKIMAVTVGNRRKLTSRFHRKLTREESRGNGPRLWITILRLLELLLVLSPFFRMVHWERMNVRHRWPGSIFDSSLAT